MALFHAQGQRLGHRRGRGMGYAFFLASLKKKEGTKIDQGSYR